MKHLQYLTFLCFLTMFASAAPGQEIIDQWRYTLRPPANGWQQPEFDDSRWTEGFGGFGTRNTPGSRIGTIWDTKNIWLRKSFELNSVPAKPALLIHHDEDAEVYINGDLVAAMTGFTSKFIVVPIKEDKRSAFRNGENSLAVHCKQVHGGQFIDVHVIDADSVPKLPAAKRTTKPHQSDLITQWGAKVTSENVWTQYPRPQLQRTNWTSLNGHWNYAVTAEGQTKPPEEWAGKILVPFCLESKLSGVQRLLDPSEALWYEREFNLESKPIGRLLLHFEAVDYEATIWVNGELVGKHTGGNLPFRFDITSNVKPGPNKVQLKVLDRTNAKGSFQLIGKQRLQPGGITYTRVSGIWQTVWLEEVPQNYIQSLKILGKTDGTIQVNPTIIGGGDIRTEVSLDGAIVARGGQTVQVDHPMLWSPDSPTLYELKVTLVDESGAPLDTVKSYTGLREVGKKKDANGHWRFTLNGEEIFHWGPLDQGWWPDGLLTPPSEAAMLFELNFLKRAGFNMIRKHIKIEPRRYYYHCDRMGFLVWQDQVSGGINPPWERLDPARNKRNAPRPEDSLDAVWPDDAHQQWMAELKGMIDHLYNSPSIVVWTPFNERWGQHRTIEVGKWISKYDPTRLIDIASGGNFFPVGEVADMHSYPDPAFPFHLDKYDDYVKVVGEFGGHGYPVTGHLWDPSHGNWGYGGLPKNAREYKERYVNSIRILNDLRARGVSGGVYTQTTDVEVEINGLMTYDRKVIKIPAEELAELHSVLFTETPEQASKADQFSQ